MQNNQSKLIIIISYEFISKSKLGIIVSLFIISFKTGCVLHWQDYLWIDSQECVASHGHRDLTHKYLKDDNLFNEISKDT